VYMPRWLVSSLALMYVLLPARSAYPDWEIRRDIWHGDRPPIIDGVTSVLIGQQNAPFPRYLNEIGVKRICIRFTEAGDAERKLSFIWSGGSLGPDQFQVEIDGKPVGHSEVIDTPRRPHAWYRTELACRLGPGREHLIEISSPPGLDSAIEFAAIRLSASTAGPYQPLCYESVGSLAHYEQQLGRPGHLAARAHVSVFAPGEMAAQADELASVLERAYGELRTIFGTDTLFKFSVEHYPKGRPRGWGGISGAGTIGYTTESLQRFGLLKTTDVRGFVGYLEEMCHGFKAYYGCAGTYEAIGIAICEEAVRRMVPQDVADAYWLPEHRQWDSTHAAYLEAGRTNPDATKYPWGVFYTRILNALFLRLRTEYGPRLWPDFFRTLREMDYPLHRAAKTDLLQTYADTFSRIFKRDMRGELSDFGIDLYADPPWGWQTYTQ